MIDASDWLSNFQVTSHIIHAYYLLKAYQEAENSIDPSTALGALLVSEGGKILAKDHNRFTNGFIPLQDHLYDRIEKKKYLEHAERNVIYQAARKGIKTEGLTVYCPWYSCKDCARAIVQAGIRVIVGHKFLFDITPLDIQKRLTEAFSILDAANVICLLYEGNIEGIRIRFKNQNYMF